ncbi:MAG TPA: hypothetical protein VK105_06460 [Virgibacillus sp.]|nr:hypothetical protein [Virgibacillus sp.]HLR66769.1 hypothetical protein [Virgibacillus sp.]
MRFSDRVTFVTQEEGGLDPDTGNHKEGEKITYQIPANINTLGTNRTVELFGELDKEIKVIRLIQPYYERIDYVLINDVKHVIQKRVNHRRKTVLYVERDNFG